jgi:hypothetical protein
MATAAEGATCRTETATQGGRCEILPPGWQGSPPPRSRVLPDRTVVPARSGDVAGGAAGHAARARYGRRLSAGSAKRITMPKGWVASPRRPRGAGAASGLGAPPNTSAGVALPKA